MEAKQLSVIVLAVICLPVVVVVGVCMTLCGHDPWRDLKRMADARKGV